MTAAAQALPQPESDNLRPFDFHRDLGAVADLIELCFAGRLDEDGHRYVTQMRRAAHNPKLLAWALTPGKAGNPSMGGFVWQESGEIIGNLSCLPIIAAGQRGYLIANVAVHPDHQRKGIARRLTEAALDYFRAKGVRWSWLQVDDDNLPALKLYEDAGFSEEARRTTWHTSPQSTTDETLAGNRYRITRRFRRDWDLQRRWLDRIYPPSITWHLPLRKSLLKPGLRGYLNRTMNDKRVIQKALRRDDVLLGVGVVQSSISQSDKIWLATSSEHEHETILQLLPQLRINHPKYRTLALDFPAGKCEEVLYEAGFYKHQTLIWMRRKV